MNQLFSNPFPILEIVTILLILKSKSTRHNFFNDVFCLYFSTFILKLLFTEKTAWTFAMRNVFYRYFKFEIENESLDLWTLCVFSWKENVSFTYQYSPFRHLISFNLTRPWKGCFQLIINCYEVSQSTYLVHGCTKSQY